MPFWAPYVPVARRRANAKRQMEKLCKKGKIIEPVEIEGRTIARSFWGKGWCDHLESFSDFENRLPRGRTYVRNGSVCHLAIRPGHIEAIVSGSSLYKVSITIKKLKPALWQAVKERCSGRIGSMLELLQGKLSDQVMAVVTDRTQGLFPQPSEIELSCNCPDWATMCKHVAAVLYGVGSRLDTRPELLFVLRDVDPQELISAELSVPTAVATGDVLAADQLGDIFGIDLDAAGEQPAAPQAAPPGRLRTGKRAATSKVEKAKSAARPGPAAGSKRSKVSAKARKKAVADKASAGEVARSGPPARAEATEGQSIRLTGAAVAKLRKKLGLSVAEFARALSVAPGSVYRWEAATGRLKLHARILAAVTELQRTTGSGQDPTPAQG